MDCQFKDALGKPREGIHAIRIPVIDIALVDTLLTVIAALVFSKLFKSSFIWTFIVFIVIAIVIHRVLCVDTRLNQLIFKKK